MYTGRSVTWAYPVMYELHRDAPAAKSAVHAPHDSQPTQKDKPLRIDGGATQSGVSN